MSSNQKTQYDNISDDYDIIKTLFHNRIEQHNIKKNVIPFLEGGNTTVLDLACGTGFYSHLMLEWGASHVTGVDISQSMLDKAAVRLASHNLSLKSRFIQGDAEIQRSYGRGEIETYDLATGFWLLNYAETYEELKAMFKTMNLNIKPSGAFLGILMPPREDIEEFAKIVSKNQAFQTGVKHIYEDQLVEGQGYAIQVVVSPPSAKPFEFKAYHLKKSLFEKAARDAGFHSGMEWRELEILDEWLEGTGVRADDESWINRKELPQMGVLVLCKT